MLICLTWNRPIHTANSAYKYPMTNPSSSPGDPPWLCVLGGGGSQLPFVRAAADLGVRTLVFDRDPESPARSPATRFEPLSTHDADGIRSFCESFFGPDRRLRGVLCYSSHPRALNAAAGLRDRYKLGGGSGETVRALTTRTIWKRKLEQDGVPTPYWRRVGDGEDLAPVIRAHGPLMVKPAGGSAGSAGVAVAKEAGDAGALREVLREACRHSPDGKAMVEAYCSGPEYSVDAFLRKGELHVAALSRKYVGGPGRPFLMEGFHLGAVPPETADRLRRLAVRVARIVGLRRGFLSLDVIASGEELKVVDMGPLLDAKIDRLLFHGGARVYELAVRLSLEGSAASRLPPESERGIPAEGALRFLYAPREGRLRTKVEGTRTIRSGEAEGTVTVEWGPAPGSEVAPPRSLADALGWVTCLESERSDPWDFLEGVDPSSLFVAE